jgi:hypothetical protein
MSHPVVLLFLKTPKFRVFDLLCPFSRRLQPWINVAGAAAMYFC